MKRKAEPQWKWVAATQLARFGLDRELIAESLGVRPSTVTRWLKQWGLELSRRKDGPPEAHLESFRMPDVIKASGGAGAFRRRRCEPGEALRSLISATIKEARRTCPARRRRTPQEIRILYLKKRHAEAKAKLRLKQGVGPLKDRLSNLYWQGLQEAQAAAKLSEAESPETFGALRLAQEKFTPGAHGQAQGNEGEVDALEDGPGHPGGGRLPGPPGRDPPP